MNEGADDKRMCLRHAGACRVCGVELPARVEAIYERTTKTVRWVRHDAGPAVQPSVLAVIKRAGAADVAPAVVADVAPAVVADVAPAVVADVAPAVEEVVESGPAESSARAPLFGRHVGSFFVPAHARGSGTHGVVLSVYDTRAPIGGSDGPDLPPAELPSGPGRA